MSYFTNIAVQNVNKGFLYITDFRHGLKRPTIIYGGGWRNVFLGKHFANPIIKKSKTFFTQSQISIKTNKYPPPPLPKNFTKGYHSVVIRSSTTSVT
jgi:hypothetical protein